MDRRKLFFGLAVVFGAFGLLALASPQTFYGSGTFYDRNYGLIQTVSIGSVVLGGVFAAIGAAVRRS